MKKELENFIKVGALGTLTVKTLYEKFDKENIIPTQEKHTERKVNFKIKEVCSKYFILGEEEKNFTNNIYCSFPVNSRNKEYVQDQYNNDILIKEYEEYTMNASGFSKVHVYERKKASERLSTIDRLDYTFNK